MELLSCRLALSAILSKRCPQEPLKSISLIRRRLVMARQRCQ
jgi:hypothetical protein